jgi:hypothetical protein
MKRNTFPLISVLALLTLSACDTKLDACPAGVVLTAEDLPCSCGKDDVEDLPSGSDCICLDNGRVNCDSQTDTSGL